MQGRVGNPELRANSGNISLIEQGQTRDIIAKKSGLGSGKTCSTPGACNTTQRTAYSVQPGREHDSPRRARSARQRGHFATRGDRQAGQTRDIALRKAGPCIPRKTAPFRGHAQRWNRPVTASERVEFEVAPYPRPGRAPGFPLVGPARLHLLDLATPWLHGDQKAKGQSVRTGLSA
ncbi:hypothetical protein ebA2661 [Aromatoleum aromaticum EbN1]|uniref:Uncharacterized protein n=1 Tax=Aromatoleum aromaticum (strain DSM 19018 / LMG 30748 / EbN1) TaxID=76114 RepID=Q5P4Z1_AROAE|nr:hypothetical protein ebA2661 [Aromatoleum aromaticum EbN1]